MPSVDGAGTGRGAVARIEANLTALRTLRRLQAEGRLATEQEQQDLSHWTSWGAVPAIFDESKDVFRAQRQKLSDLLDPVEWAAARRTTINAHYTDPAYVQAIWSGLDTLGFAGGNVLEPGSGVGLFVGLAPATARMVGVELDPVTAGISAALYPDATIRAESFADSPFPDASFDAVFGNVPFSDVTLRDRRHNEGGLSMHNHFIVKSLALTRPGGMVAVLTSRFTMDAKDRSAREAMSAMGDLVTAVRLPSGAHKKFAGTEAATDLLVFQRRVDGALPADTSWLDVQSHLVRVEKPVAGEPDQVPVTVNSWWSTHPQSVVGHEVVAHGMYGVGLVVRPDDPRTITQDVATAITAAIESAASEDGWSFTEPEPDRVRVDLDQVVTPVARMGDVRQFAGRISYDEQSESFTTFTDGLQAPFAVPKAQHAQMRALLGLRDDVTAVLAQEASNPEDTSELVALRARLNQGYDAYVARFGPVGSVKLSDSWKENKKTGQSELRTRRTYPGVIRLFEKDPHSAIVKALENYDESTNTATKAAVFDRRVVSPRITRDHADTPADAVSIALDNVGEVRLEDVAALLGVSEQQARADLGTLVFDDPGEVGRLVPAPEYLSGNVRHALDLARESLEERPELQVNIDALEAVVPTPLEAGDINVKLGSSWVPAADVQRFLRETLKDRSVVVEHVGGSAWSVEGNKSSPAAESTWGTRRMDAITMTERLLTQKRIVVNQTVENARGNEVRVPSPLETDAAQDKAAALQERFGQWAWEDPARAQRLVDLYNEKFNSIVLRSYTQEGQRLSLPGLAATINPHPHQRAAVARIISEPSVGLYHAVGAGKTGEMVMGAMELRRLGLVNKPAIVVPNHMLEFSALGKWCTRQRRCVGVMVGRRCSG
ncbi:MAG: methyltransferase domain-containing protein [Actinomycetota bacterium]|nr:methyltransferase domain-containing protein [Actinomycetota bacterium]